MEEEDVQYDFQETRHQLLLLLLLASCIEVTLGRNLTSNKTAGTGKVAFLFQDSSWPVGVYKNVRFAGNFSFDLALDWRI